MEGVNIMKNRRKSIVAFTSFIVIFVLLLNLFSMILIPKDNQMSKTIRGFYEEKRNSLDVLFLGDSSMYRSIIPAQLWKKNGFTSYALGAPSIRPYALYYLLEEALKTQKPKVVVMEVNCAFNNHKYAMGNKRKVIDHMRFSMNKIAMIHDPAFQFSLKDKISLLFPVFLYHNRYNEVNAIDIAETFKSPINDTKGYISSYKQKPYKGKINYMHTSSQAMFDADSRKYMDMIYDVCKKHNIKLMLLKVPGAKEWNQGKKAAVEQYAKERHLPYLDLNTDMQNSIDWRKDTNDSGVHLNIFGAEKVTAELSQYFHRHYHLKKTKDREIIKTFDRAYRLFNEKRKLYKRPILTVQV